MDIIESVRIAMRQRLFAADIIPPEQFQEEYKPAPDGGSYYIRETVIDMGRTEPSQASELQTVLVEYDIIAHSKWLLNPLVTVGNIVENIRAEFNVKDPEKINVALPDHPTVQAWLRDPVTTSASEQDGDWWRRPVMIYVECLIRWE
jgi:hypothetical protein